ncbi:MAG: signal peptidase I [Bacilli bacterium]
MNKIMQIIKENTVFIIALILILVIRFYFISIDVVVGSSMEPTLSNDDVVIVDSKFYKLTELERFDIIIFDNDKSNEEFYLVKRVIGLPGETVEMKNNELYINGNKIKVSSEILRMNQKTLDFNSGVIPQNHYFVLGDNRELSLDSRSEDVGYVSKNNITGKTIFRQRPFNKMGFVK